MYAPKQKIEESTTPAALLTVLDEKPGIKKIYLHLDNDNAGRRATTAMKAILPDRYEVIDLPPKRGKDYNDYLCYLLGITRNKSMERNEVRE